MLMNESELKRFEDKIAYEPMSGCHLWTGSLDGRGYPNFRFRGKTIRGSRLSLMHYKGVKFKEGDQANHKCHTPCCVNSDHLYMGTQIDNMQDLKKSGRRKGKNASKGSEHYKTDLTEEKVIAIKKTFPALERAEITQDDIIDHFGITRSQLSAIKIGDTWKHVDTGIKEVEDLIGIPRNARGVKNPSSKLTEEQVRIIKYKLFPLLNSKYLTMREIETLVGLKRNCGSSIKNGKTWGWV